MIGQKLVKMLQTLDPAAFRRLGDAFVSPAFTTSPLLLKLYRLLKKEYPRFEPARLSKERLFKSLYPDKPSSDGLLRVLVHEFNKVTENFILLESVRDNETLRQKALTEWYGRNNMYAEFEKQTLSILAKMEQQPFRDVEHYQSAADLYAAYFFHQNTEKHTLADSMLTRMMDSVDRGYILLKLRLASEMKNRERILSKHYEVVLLDEVLTTGAAGLLKDNVAFELYRLVLMLYTPGEHDDIFRQIRDLLLQQIDRLRYFDQSMLLTQVINYVVRQLNQGNKAYSRELLTLYQLALAHQLILSNGKIEASVYQNIVSSGCMEKEMDWTAQFIESYAPYLSEEIRMDCKTMALATWHFHQADYNKAFQLIAEHRFFNVLIQVNARILLIKTCFEKFMLDNLYFDLLMSQLDAFEKFIRRHSVISSFKKEENLHFIKVLKSFAVLFLQKKPASEIRNRLESLDSTYKTHSKDWLLLKIEQYN